MKKLVASLTWAFVMSLCLAPTLLARQDSPELTEAARAVESELVEKMPGWEHRRVTPIEGSKDVIISQWESQGLMIRVSIILHQSEEELRERIKKYKSRFKQEDKGKANEEKNSKIFKGDEHDLGDEGFSWRDFNFYGTVFKKGRYTVHVNLIKPEVDETNLTREIARHVAKALR